MSTRASILIENKYEYQWIYRHFDGYPAQVESDLEILKHTLYPGTSVNLAFQMLILIGMIQSVDLPADILMNPEKCTDSQIRNWRQSVDHLESKSKDVSYMADLVEAPRSVGEGVFNQMPFLMRVFLQLHGDNRLPIAPSGFYEWTTGLHGDAEYVYILDLDSLYHVHGKTFKSAYGQQ